MLENRLRGVLYALSASGRGRNLGKGQGGRGALPTWLCAPPHRRILDPPMEFRTISPVGRMREFLCIVRRTVLNKNKHKRYQSDKELLKRLTGI